MRVLVTGHRGYIGAVLAPIFEAAGHEVVGLDSDLYRGCTFGDPALLPAVPDLELDLRDVTVERLAGIDAIVHLAALSNDPVSDLDPVLTYDINHAASVRLARLGREAGVRRFLFSSSCSNYGAAGGAFMDEDSELHPVTAYGESKVRVERDLADLDGPDYVRRLAPECDCVRRLAPVALRRGPEQPGGVGRTRRGSSASRATARRGARSSTSGTSPKRSSSPSTRPARSSAAVRSTSWRQPRTTRSETSRRSSPTRWAAASRSRPTPRPTSATTVSAATGSPRQSGSRPPGMPGAVLPNWRPRSGQPASRSTKSRARNSSGSPESASASRTAPCSRICVSARGSAPSDNPTSRSDDQSSEPGSRRSSVRPARPRAAAARSVEARARPGPRWPRLAARPSSPGDWCRW